MCVSPFCERCIELVMNKQCTFLYACHIGHACPDHRPGSELSVEEYTAAINCTRWSHDQLRVGGGVLMQCCGTNYRTPGMLLRFDDSHNDWPIRYALLFSQLWITISRRYFCVSAATQTSRVPCSVDMHMKLRYSLDIEQSSSFFSPKHTI